MCIRTPARLADFLHCLVQRRPFLIQTFILDLPQLDIGDVVFLGDDLVGTTHRHSKILGRYQIPEDVAPLLQRQTFMQAGQEMIRISDNPVPWDKDFRFFMTTKLTNPHVPASTAVVTP